MTIIKGGRTNYGETIGIIMLDTVFPRIPGDVGNASTFPFPVRYKVVRGASLQRVVKEADPALLEPFIQAAKELEHEGVRAITTSCGFLAIFQKEIANALNIPVFTSSLLQVPMVQSFLSKEQKVGIITARARSLSSMHLAGVGIENCRLVIEGMDEAEAFTSTFVEGNPLIDIDKCTAEMVETAQRLVDGNPEVGAIVLECTNMPPFAKAVQDAVKLPVFDIVTLINYVHASVLRKQYLGNM